LIGTMGTNRGFLVITLGVLFPFPGLVAGGQAAPSGRFERLVPGDGDSVYASIHGGTPLLAWQHGPHGGCGMDHYEVWIDGVKVDEVPAAGHGHLPGERHGNYEPFRPWGVLAPGQACYYTPLPSKLTPGWRMADVTRLSGGGMRVPMSGRSCASCSRPSTGWSR